MSTFQCNVSHEFVYDATAGTAKKRARRTVQSNQLCGLKRDEFDHVCLWFGKSVKAKSKLSFRLEHNIKALYYSNLADGKLTIELKAPHTLIYIDPSSEAMRVDKDAGKLATPIAHVPQLKSLARKLRRIQKSAKHAKDLLLTWSEDEREVDENDDDD